MLCMPQALDFYLHALCGRPRFKHILPAAAWYLTIIGVQFSALRAENCTPTEIKYRSAEGEKRRLRKSCYLHELCGRPRLERILPAFRLRSGRTAAWYFTSSV